MESRTQATHKLEVLIFSSLSFLFKLSCILIYLYPAKATNIVIHKDKDKTYIIGIITHQLMVDTPHATLASGEINSLYTESYSRFFKVFKADLKPFWKLYTFPIQNMINVCHHISEMLYYFTSHLSMSYAIKVTN